MTAIAILKIKDLNFGSLFNGLKFLLSTMTDVTEDNAQHRPNPLVPVGPLRRTRAEFTPEGRLKVCGVRKRGACMRCQMLKLSVRKSPTLITFEQFD